MGLKSFRSALLLGAAALGMSAASAALTLAYAQEATRTYAIGPQELDDALREFGRQTGRDILFSPYAVVGKRSPGVQGQITERQALDALLAGTGLTYQQTPSNGYAVQDPASPTQLGNAEAEPSEEIVITGSRLPRSEASPVVTVDSSDLEERGITSVGDALTYVTQQSFTLREGANVNGARTARLRGLAVGTTLVLINGRRVVPSALLGSTSEFDLNTIPTTAIDRIEVLADSASAVYGADAVGGVINIILKTDDLPPTLDLFYGAPADGGEERRASVSFGHSGDRLHLTGAFDYYERDFLIGADRDFSANQDFRRFGGADSRQPFANPGNIRTTNGANLPGLTSSFAAVPVGSSGVGLTPASFTSTAGTTNLESLAAFSSLLPETTRLSVAGSASYDVTPHIQIFADTLFADREDTTLTIPSFLIGTVVPATNPFNPFGVPVAVNYLFEGIGPQRQIVESRYTRALAGLRGDWASWDWEVALLTTNDDGRNTSNVNAVDNARVAAALASTNPATALNVFQDGPGGSQALLQSLIAPPSVNEDTSSSLQLDGNIRGTILTLPAGDVDVVLGAEARSEELSFEIISSGISLDAERDTVAAYAEARLPIVSPDMNVPLMEDLTTTLAVRWDKYDDFGETVNPKYGLEWSVGGGLLLRGTYSTGFRAPSLFELYRAPNSFLGGLFDPRRNNQLTFATIFMAGNPGLQPEESESFSVGFVFEPNEIYRFSVNYWSIELENGVRTLSPTIAEATFPSLITRAPPTPADILAGLPGIITSATFAPVNFAQTETSGVDFEAAAHYEIGGWSIDPSVNATWVDRFAFSDLPNGPVTDRVGLALPAGAIPDWRATATLSLSRDWWSASLSYRYVSSFTDTSISSVPLNHELPEQHYLDASMSFSMEHLLGNDSAIEGARLRIGGRNLFDRQPDFAFSGGSSGYNLSQGDIVGRYVYIGLTTQF